MVEKRKQGNGREHNEGKVLFGEKGAFSGGLSDNVGLVGNPTPLKEMGPVSCDCMTEVSGTGHSEWHGRQ